MVFTLVLAASCNRKFEYEPMTYATLYQTSYSVYETVGEVRVPVLLNNSNGSEVQVSVKLNAGKAVEGVDYELISPASGILTFSGETDSLDVVIGITSFEGEFTGAKDFSLEISSLTAGVTVANVNTIARFKINDLDHPLSALFGDWSGSIPDYFNQAYVPITVTISEDPEDKTYKGLKIQNLDPYFHSATAPLLSCYVDNLENPTTITVPAGQYLGHVEGYPNGILSGYDDSLSKEGFDVVISINEDGTLTITNAFMAAFEDGSGYAYSLYLPGAVLSKK